MNPLQGTKLKRDHAVKCVSKFYTKVRIWCDMTKGLRVLSLVLPVVN